MEAVHQETPYGEEGGSGFERRGGCDQRLESVRRGKQQGLVDEPRLACTGLAAHGKDSPEPADDAAQEVVEAADLIVASEQWRQAAFGAGFPGAAPAGVVIEAIEVAGADRVRSWFAVANTEQPQGQLPRLAGEEDLARERSDAQ